MDNLRQKDASVALSLEGPVIHGENTKFPNAKAEPKQEVAVRRKERTPENRKGGNLQSSSDVSMLSDSDNAYLSSSPNSTLKSDISGSGPKPRPSHKEVVATLDSFLMDINQATEEAKQKEEELKIKQQKKVVEEKESEKSSSTSSSIRRCKSLPSVVSEGDENDQHIDRLPRSSTDLRSPYIDVFSDDEQENYKDVDKSFLYIKKRNKNNISMSSQGSDAPEAYGIRQLNHLCTFLEQFKQLQIENTELTKRVSNLEDTYRNVPPQTLNPNHRPSFQDDLPPPVSRNSAVFSLPKQKPKKLPKSGKIKALHAIQHKDKSKSKNRYSALVNLPFVFTTKSVENLKFSSSANLDKMHKEKMPTSKKPSNYSQDDIEIGKYMHGSGEWRQSSVKSPSSEDADKTFTEFLPETALSSPPAKTEDHPDSPPYKVPSPVVEEKITPTIVLNQELTPVESPLPTVQNPSPPDTTIKKVFPTKSPSPAKAKNQGRKYVNTKKMREWGALQEAFPVPQVETNVDILNHLESVLNNSGKIGRRSNFQAFRRHSKGKKDKGSSQMYLPSTEVQGFASTILAAHTIANQLTLTLTLGDLEPFTSSTNEENQQTSMTSAAV